MLFLATPKFMVTRAKQNTVPHSLQKTGIRSTSDQKEITFWSKTNTIMFIGQGRSLEAYHAAQAERPVANTVMWPHLRQLWRPSRLCQRLCHYLISPCTQKWNPCQPPCLPINRPLLLPHLSQPPHLPMDRPLLLPVVWRFLSMPRIFTKHDCLVRALMVT